MTFGDGAWKVTKGAMVVARGHKTRTLYMTSSCRDMVAILDNTKKTELWHCRLGHMSEKGMKLLVRNGKIPELKSVEHHLCESCILVDTPGDQVDCLTTCIDAGGVEKSSKKQTERGENSLVLNINLSFLAKKRSMC